MNTRQKNILLSAEALVIAASAIKKALQEDASAKDKIFAGVSIAGTGGTLAQLTGVVPANENEHVSSQFENYYSVVRIGAIAVNVAGMMRGEDAVKKSRTALLGIRLTAAAYIVAKAVKKTRVTDDADKDTRKKAL
jgi:hypothetical protein